MPRRSEKKRSIASCVLWVAVMLAGCIFMLRPLAVWGGPVTGAEYNVKIGFIYNFAKFITWPPEAFEKNPDTLVFCFATEDPSVDVFYKLDGKIVSGRKIKVVAYQDGACLEQSQILFFATQNKAFIQQVLELTQGRSILTIGEVDGFTQWGGVIDFFEEQDRLRFKVNIDAANRERLKVSSQLLVSAQIVREEQD